MINPKFEIDRLRQTLIWKGLDDREATEVSNLAAGDIAEAISELALNALAEAIQYGEQLGIDNFSEIVRVVNTGNTVSITTDTGKTDFSWDSIHMLPNLLKNPKHAKDGSLYKVIPMKKKKTSTSSADTAIDMQQAQTIARDALKHNRMGATSGDPLQSSSLFSGLAQAREFMASKKKVREQQLAVSEGQEFRTASSKQDATTMWVIPPKDRDMTIVLTDINRALEDNIQNSVQNIIKQYEGLV